MSENNAPRVGRSLARVQGDGQTRRFSTIDDYQDALRKAGQLGTGERLEDHPELLPAVFQAWVQGGQLGCLFAVDFARRQESDLRASWQQLVVNDEPLSRTLHRRLNDILVSPDPPNAVSVLFPRIKDTKGIVSLISLLCEDPRWGWEDIPSKDATCVLVGLRWRLPVESSVSWVLGFAPIDTMPFTRRAPWTAIMLRPVESGRVPPAGQLDYVHLADLPPYAKPKGERADLWGKTAQYKVDLLPSQAERDNAKARITFTLPVECRKLLPPAQSYLWAPQEKQ